MHSDKNQYKSQQNKKKQVAHLSTVKQNEEGIELPTKSRGDNQSTKALQGQVLTASEQQPNINMHESSPTFSNQRQITIPAGNANIEMIIPQNVQVEIERSHNVLNNQTTSSTLVYNMQPSSYHCHQTFESIPKYTVSVNSEIVHNQTIPSTSNVSNETSSVINDYLKPNAEAMPHSVSQRMDTNSTTLVQLMAADMNGPRVLSSSLIQQDHPFLANIISNSGVSTNSHNLVTSDSYGEASSDSTLNTKNLVLPST